MDCASCSALKIKGKTCWRHVVPETPSPSPPTLPPDIMPGTILRCIASGKDWHVQGHAYVGPDLVYRVIEVFDPSIGALIYRCDIDAGGFLILIRP